MTITRGPETPTPTAPTSPTSPTSTFVTPSGDCIVNVDPEKSDGIVKDTDTNEKSDVTAFGRSQLNMAPTVVSTLTQADLKEGSLQRRLTDLTKRFTSSIRPPLVLSRHRQSDGALKLVQRSVHHRKRIFAAHL
jgi:hypothetical protein